VTKGLDSIYNDLDKRKPLGQTDTKQTDIQTEKLNRHTAKIHADIQKDRKQTTDRQQDTPNVIDRS